MIQIIVLILGGLFAVTGIVLFAKRGVRGKNTIKILGSEFHLAGSSLVVFVLGCVLILAALRVNFATGPAEPTLNKTRDNPPPPVMPPLPDFVTRYVYDTNEVERVEFEIEPGRLSAQGIEPFLWSQFFGC